MFCSRRTRLPNLAALATLSGLTAVCTLFAPGSASASGYLTARFGSDHGTPAQPNAFAIYFNPAALGGTTGTTITGDASVLLRFASYTRGTDALSPSDDALRSDQNYVNSNTGTARLTNLLALPFLGVNTDFGTQNFRAGYAAYIPFGGLATWNRTSGVPGVPGSTDGVQRWHNISGQILAIYNTFAFAYKIAPAKLTIGASVSPVIHHVATVRARNADGSDDTTSAGSLVEGRSLIDATGINIAASAGLYFEPSEKLRLGLSYLSQPGFGETRMSGELRFRPGTSQASTTQVDFLQTYPDVVRFGAAGRISDKLELRGDVEFVRWSVFKRQCVVTKGGQCGVADDGKRLPGPEGDSVQLNVPRNWKDAFGVRIGPAYAMTENLELFGSLGMTTPAVPKQTIDASTIDAYRLYAALGAKYDVNKNWAIAGSYNHIYFFDVDTKGENDQNLAATPGGDYNASRSPSADGTYRSQIGFVNVNVAYTF
jgi:long-chain fatty acid transport protein